MSDIANLLWQVKELKDKLENTDADLAAARQEVAELKETVQHLVSDKLENILERIMKAVELSVDIQSANTLATFYTPKAPDKS